MMFPSPIPSWIFINRRVMRGPIWEQHNAIFSTTQTLFRKKKSQLCVSTHFGQADGTLLGRHVASSRVDLWEFGNVVLLVLLSFTFWEVCPPENGYKEHFIRQNSSSPTRQWLQIRAPFYPWGYSNCTCKRTLLHQQLTDILKLVHIGEPLLHQLLDSTAQSHRDNLQAAAGWEQHIGQFQCVISKQSKKTKQTFLSCGGSSVRLLWT